VQLDKHCHIIKKDASAIKTYRRSRVDVSSTSVSNWSIRSGFGVGCACGVGNGVGVKVAGVIGIGALLELPADTVNLPLSILITIIGRELLLCAVAKVSKRPARILQSGMSPTLQKHLNTIK